MPTRLIAGIILAGLPFLAAAKPFTIEVRAGKHDRELFAVSSAQSRPLRNFGRDPIVRETAG